MIARWFREKMKQGLAPTGNGLARILPAEYCIQPAVVDFWIPGFAREGRWRTLAPQEVDCARWFESFHERIVAAIGRSYLPVCRLSDGEFRFCLGVQPPSKLWGSGDRARLWLHYGIERASGLRGFRAATRPGVSSGEYSRRERRAAREYYQELIRQISETGVLAIHFCHGNRPFQEHYFPALGAWLARGGIRLTLQNQVPFYFVYGAFTGPRRHELLRGRRVLLITSADQDKRVRIESALEREGVRQIDWCAISSARSLYDHIDVGSYRGQVDLVLVGAGIGKPNVLWQLRSLQAPCVDAGFLFEVWADPSCRGTRPYCTPDEMLDLRGGAGH
jgi:hypothetical protein